MSLIWPAQALVRVCREEGVDVWLSVHGGHTMSSDDWFAFGGGKWYHMRHEQTGVRSRRVCAVQAPPRRYCRYFRPGSGQHDFRHCSRLHE